MLINLMIEAGLPAGCLGVVHGQHDAVNFVCDNQHIKGTYILCDFSRSPLKCFYFLL